MTKKTTRYVATNEFGLRIGQDHHNAKLTDIEVEALIMDRGPDDAPTMTYQQLADKYGISKSGARMIVNGSRRGQSKRFVKREITEHRQPMAKQKKVYAQFSVTLRARAILNRIGGGRALERIAAAVESKLRRAPDKHPDDVFMRVLEKITL